MKRRHWPRLTPLIMKGVLYLYLAWYVAEVAGYGGEFRYTMRRGLQWGRYLVEYAAWIARQETRTWK